MLRCFAAALLLPLGGAAAADEKLSLCYGYGCLAFAEVRYGEVQLGEVGGWLERATDADEERTILARVIGRLYAWAGEQSPIHEDRGGNYADGEVAGKMDCIDHATSTTRLLRVLEARRLLRWHRVLEPDLRYWGLVFPAHYSAVVEVGAAGERGGEKAGEAARYVVDSWFVNNGEPAVILPLDEWKRGAGPDV